MDNVLTTNNLTKRYRKITALDKLNIEVPRKSVFGLLGPNGSGKTTTLGMVLDVIEKSEGSFNWNIGEKGDERKTIGAILESPNFYPYMSASENLKLVAKIKEIKPDKIDSILGQVGLIERKDDPFKTYSLGMKQRLAIASALLSDPEVLILDEPTNGLDPKGIVEIRQLIREIAAEGRTIILASHLLDEVQKVCTHFCVLDHGNLIYTGEVAALTKEKNRYRIGAKNQEELENFLSKSPSILKWEKSENDQFLIWINENYEVENIIEDLAEIKLTVNHISQQNFSLEQKFIEILDYKS